MSVRIIAVSSSVPLDPRRNPFATTLLLWIPLPVKRAYPSDLDGFCVHLAFRNIVPYTPNESPCVQEIDLQVWRFAHFACSSSSPPVALSQHLRWKQPTVFSESFDLSLLSRCLVFCRSSSRSSHLRLVCSSCWCLASCCSRSCSRNLDHCQSLSLVPDRLPI